jgi:multiple sugar transport system substrate-binding protein
VRARPAGQAAWDEEALSGDERLSEFGNQLEDAKAPPSIASWEQVAAEIDTVIEQVTVGDMAPEEGCTAMQEAATGIGTGQ